MEQYTQVAFIAIRNSDGTITTDVPLYVKNSEINGSTKTSETDAIHKISNLMNRVYERQISEHFSKLKAVA